MELLSVPLARAVAFLEVASADPRGATSIPESIQALAERYSLRLVPQSLADLDFAKGVEFAIGRLREIRIDKVTLYGNAVSIDTHSTTDDCHVILADLLDWAKGFSGRELIPNRIGYVSNVVFKSKLQIGKIHPVMNEVASIVSAGISKGLRQEFEFQPTAVFVGCDHTQTSVTPVPFSVERRAGSPFWDESYYSTAPLSTTEHLDLIEKMERALT